MPEDIRRKRVAQVETRHRKDTKITIYSILRNEYATSAMRIGIVLSVGSSFRNIFKTLPPSDSCQVSVILSPITGGLSEPTIVSESWITCLASSHLNLFCNARPS